MKAYGIYSSTNIAGCYSEMSAIFEIVIGSVKDANARVKELNKKEPFMSDKTYHRTDRLPVHDRRAP